MSIVRKLFSTFRASAFGIGNKVQNAGRDINNNTIILDIKKINQHDSIGRILSDAFKESSGKSFKVSIIGPFWEDSVKLSRKKNIEESARRLRAFIYKKLDNQTDIRISLGTFRYNTDNEAGLDVQEISTAVDSDLTILLPASPGSFCLTEAITAKSKKNNIILFVDKTFENSQGYISKVLFHERALDKGIEKHFVDYQKCEEIYSLIEKKISSIKRNSSRASA